MISSFNMIVAVTASTGCDVGPLGDGGLTMDVNPWKEWGNAANCRDNDCSDTDSFRLYKKNFKNCRKVCEQRSGEGCKGWVFSGKHETCWLRAEEDAEQWLECPDFTAANLSQERPESEKRIVWSYTEDRGEVTSCEDPNVKHVEWACCWDETSNVDVRNLKKSGFATWSEAMAECEEKLCTLAEIRYDDWSNYYGRQYWTSESCVGEPEDPLLQTQKRKVFSPRKGGAHVVSCEYPDASFVEWGCCEFGEANVDVRDFKKSGYATWFAAMDVCKGKDKFLCDSKHIANDDWSDYYGRRYWTSEICEDEPVDPLTLQADCSVYNEEQNRLVLQNVTSEQARAYLNYGKNLTRDVCDYGLVVCKAKEGEGWRNTDFIDPMEVNGLWGKQGQYGYFCRTWDDFKHMNAMVDKAQALLKHRIAWRKVDGKGEQICETASFDKFTYACCDKNQKVTILEDKSDSWFAVDHYCRDHNMKMCSVEVLSNRTSFDDWVWTSQPCHTEDYLPRKPQWSKVTVNECPEVTKCECPEPEVTKKLEKKRRCRAKRHSFSKKAKRCGCN